MLILKVAENGLQGLKKVRWEKKEIEMENVLKHESKKVETVSENADAVGNRSRNASGRSGNGRVEKMSGEIMR